MTVSSALSVIRRSTAPLVLKPTNAQVTLSITKRVQLRREIPTTWSTGIIRNIGHHSLPNLQRTTRHHPARHRPLNMVRIPLHSKIRNTNLIRQPLHQTRNAKVICRQVVVVDVQFVVAAVIDVLPLKFWVGGDEPGRGGVGFGLGDVLAVGTWGGDGGAGEFHADRAGSRGGVVVDFVEPDEVIGPGHVRVAGHENVVGDLCEYDQFCGSERGRAITYVILVEVLQSAILVRKISIPCIIVQRIDVTGSNRFVLARENGLRANETPCRTTSLRFGELVIEPGLLSSTHHGAAGVVADLVDVVTMSCHNAVSRLHASYSRIPVEISDRSVIITSIQHDKVDQSAQVERSPDAKIVVHLHLSDWHPLEVCTNGIHLPLVEADMLATKLNVVLEVARFSVVLVGDTVTVSLVGDFMVIPYRLGMSVVLVWLADHINSQSKHSCRKRVESHRQRDNWHDACGSRRVCGSRRWVEEYVQYSSLCCVSDIPQS